MKSEDHKKKVLVVGGIPIACEGLKGIVCDHPDLDFVGVAQQISQVPPVLKRARPDIIVTLLSFQSDVVSDIRNIMVETGDIPILVLTMHDERVYAKRVLQAGAMGYIMATASCEKIAEANFSVLNGDVVASPAVVKQMLFGDHDTHGHEISDPGDVQTCGCLDVLTDRELAVFRLIGVGKTTKMIADCLHISTKTVQSYREKIKVKLGLDSSARLAYAAALWSK